MRGVGGRSPAAGDLDGDQRRGLGQRAEQGRAGVAGARAGELQAADHGPQRRVDPRPAPLGDEPEPVRAAQQQGLVGRERAPGRRDPAERDGGDRRVGGGVGHRGVERRAVADRPGVGGGGARVGQHRGRAGDARRRGAGRLGEGVVADRHRGAAHLGVAGGPGEQAGGREVQGRDQAVRTVGHGVERPGGLAAHHRLVTPPLVAAHEPDHGEPHERQHREHRAHEQRAVLPASRVVARRRVAADQRGLQAAHGEAVRLDLGRGGRLGGHSGMRTACERFGSSERPNSLTCAVRLQLGEVDPLERAGVGGLEDDRRGDAALERLLPAARAQAPAVARLQARGSRRRHGSGRCRAPRSRSGTPR